VPQLTSRSIIQRKFGEKLGRKAKNKAGGQQDWLQPLAQAYHQVTSSQMPVHIRQ
jgi:hypothetical protein